MSKERNFIEKTVSEIENKKWDGCNHKTSDNKLATVANPGGLGIYLCTQCGTQFAESESFGFDVEKISMNFHDIVHNIILIADIDEDTVNALTKAAKYAEAMPKLYAIAKEHLQRRYDQFEKDRMLRPDLAAYTPSNPAVDQTMNTFMRNFPQHMLMMNFPYLFKQAKEEGGAEVQSQKPDATVNNKESGSDERRIFTQSFSQEKIMREHFYPAGSRPLTKEELDALTAKQCAQAEQPKDKKADGASPSHDGESSVIERPRVIQGKPVNGSLTIHDTDKPHVRRRTTIGGMRYIQRLLTDDPFGFPQVSWLSLRLTQEEKDIIKDVKRLVNGDIFEKFEFVGKLITNELKYILESRDNDEKRYTIYRIPVWFVLILLNDDLLFDIFDGYRTPISKTIIADIEYFEEEFDISINSELKKAVKAPDYLNPYVFDQVDCVR